MMRTKLCAAVCALLLLVNLGSAVHDGDHIKASTTKAPAGITLDPISLDSLALTATTSLSIDSATERKNITEIDPKHEDSKGTSTTSPETTASLNTSAPVHKTHSEVTSLETKGTPTPMPLTTSSSSAPPTAGTGGNASTSFTTQQSTHSKTHLFTSVPTTSAATNTTQASVAPSTSSSAGAQQNTSQPDEHPNNSTRSSTTPPSSTSTQAKAIADTSSQLKVGSDTTMVHESPTLYPLLAGLVSGFIITAVIITLLLFLKLRRRDNRPEFRRLQDLPMDDMMEDTPLSMYSY